MSTTAPITETLATAAARGRVSPRELIDEDASEDGLLEVRGEAAISYRAPLASKAKP